jgi:hypothetical protein
VNHTCEKRGGSQQASLQQSIILLAIFEHIFCIQQEKGEYLRTRPDDTQLSWLTRKCDVSQKRVAARYDHSCQLNFSYCFRSWKMP